jgi:hypothetical protein
VRDIHYYESEAKDTAFLVSLLVINEGIKRHYALSKILLQKDDKTMHIVKKELLELYTNEDDSGKTTRAERRREFNWFE